MSLLETLKRRYSTKEFDTSKKISEENMKLMEDLLQLAPSSTNAQPWHFLIATTDEGKQRIAKAAEGVYVFNKQKVLDAAAVIVFCGRHDVDEAFLLEVLEQEDKDGRFEKQQFKDDMHKGRSFFVNRHRYELKDIEHWAEKQVSINLGQFLLGVAELGLDAVPMEGFNFNILDEEFKLREKGFTAFAVVGVGYHKETDFNATMPKSRLPKDVIIEHI